MENAQLIAASTQSALKRQLSVVANNIANVNTAGFKSQTLRFEEFIMPVAEASHFNGARDQALSYVQDAESLYNLKPGALTQTDAPLDVAINGDGWFTVETEQGPRFTRDGNFTINDQGELVTQTGYKILSNGTPIVLSAEDAEIEIAADGTISSNLGIRGQLQAVTFDEGAPMVASGLNLFNAPDPKPATGVTFVQGAIEKSNTEPVSEITKLIEVTRTYQSISNILKEIDDLREKAIGRLGQFKA